ncbi:Protein unc-45 A [Geranomyces michiganensis]|nr:Protein unc-45 A [Geranomyces michiganensis]
MLVFEQLQLLDLPKTFLAHVFQSQVQLVLPQLFRMIESRNFLSSVDAEMSAGASWPESKTPMTQPQSPSSTATAASIKTRLLAESAAHAGAKRYNLALASLKTALALDKADPETLAALRALVQQATQHASTNAAAQTPAALLLAATCAGGGMKAGERGATDTTADASCKLAMLSAGDTAVCSTLLAEGAVEKLLPALLGSAEPGDRPALCKVLTNILASQPSAAISMLPFFTAENLNTLFTAVADRESLTRQCLDLIATVVHRSAQDSTSNSLPLLTNASAVLDVLVAHLTPQRPPAVRAAAFGCLIRAIASEPLALALVKNVTAATALIALVADSDSAVRSLVPAAFLRIFEQVQKTPANRAAVQAALGSHISECVADTASQKGKRRTLGILALAALFQADGACAAALFDANMLDVVLRDVERNEHDAGPAAQDTRLAFLELLSAACGEKQSRTLIGAQCGPFLTRIVNNKTNAQQATVAAVTLTKLQVADPAFAKTSAGITLADSIAMADVFIATLLAPNNASLSAPDGLRAAATEGLAYLSLRPRIKAHIAAHPTFLKHVLAPSNGQHKPITFGLATVLANLTDFRRKLTQEERNVRDLRRMAKADEGAGSRSNIKNLSDIHNDDDDDEDDPLDDDDAVKARGVAIAQSGAVPAMLAQGDEPASARVRAAVARTLCSLACNERLRGLLIQQRAVRGLLELTRSRHSEDESATTRFAAHALAKIAITADPNVAFRGDLATELVRPLLELLREDNHGNNTINSMSSFAPSSLVRFEALLALTNLASFPPARERIAHAYGVPLFEAHLFADHPLLRRAATEAICNMVFENGVFEAYVGGKASNRVGGGAAAFRMLLALADAEDFETRRAAAGAIAVLTVAPAVCARIAAERFDNAAAAAAGGDDDERNKAARGGVPRGIEIVIGLLDPPIAAAGLASAATAVQQAGELQHRGVECVKNMCNAGKEIAELMVAAGARKAVERLAAARGQQVAQVVREGAADALAAMRQWGLP